MNNLLSNAFKFTESGKVTLSVVAEPLPTSDITLILVVRDTGCGMSGKQLSTVFDEYTRFEENDSTTIEGTGLGLAITKRLVNLMNGGISVESEQGSGTVFIVKLPQKTVDDEILGTDVAESLQECRMSYIARDRRRQLVRELMPYGRILVVDDVEPNLYVSVGLMKPYGMKVETVLSGFEAIKKVKAGNIYDIIFMDHMMPEMDGIETTHRLRGMGYKEPIIALTANAVTGQADVFLQNGFNEFISKPIDIRQLNVILNQYVRDKQPPEVVDAARAFAKSIEAGEISLDNGPSNGKILSDKSISFVKEQVINGLDITEGLNRYNNDVDVYLAILRSYMTNIRSMTIEIESYDVEKNEDYKVTVHGIKGASFDIFATEIGENAGSLEDASKDNNYDFIIENNPAFILTLKQLISDIEKMFFEVDALNPKPKKNKPDEELLSRLLKACKEFNMNEADTVMTEIDEYQYTSDNGLVVWLRENIDVMNYSLIIEKLAGDSDESNDTGN